MRHVSLWLPLLAAHLRNEEFSPPEADTAEDSYASLQAEIAKWKRVNRFAREWPSFEAWARNTKNAGAKAPDLPDSAETSGPAPPTARDPRGHEVLRLEDLMPDFEHCRVVVLDLGTSFGVHLRSVFEGARYPGSEFEQLLTDELGPRAWRAQPSNETGFCGLGIEARAERQPRLRALEACYRARGWTVRFLVPAAVSDTGNETRASVPTVDPSEIVKQFLAQQFLREKRKVIVKMDIGGAEYKVLPHMERENLFCNGRTSIVTVNWHDAVKAGYDSATEETVQERYCDGPPSRSYRAGAKILYFARRLLGGNMVKRLLGVNLFGTGPAGRTYAPLGGYAQSCDYSPTRFIDLDDTKYSSDSTTHGGNACPDLH